MHTAVLAGGPDSGTFTVAVSALLRAVFFAFAVERLVRERSGVGTGLAWLPFCERGLA